MKCQSCGANHLRKLSMVVEEGTRRTVSTGPRYTVHHTSRTDLAARHDVTVTPAATWVQIFYYVPAFVLSCMLAGKTLFVAKSSMLVGLGLQACAGFLAVAVLYLVLRFLFPGVHSRLVQDRQLADKAATDFYDKWLCMSCGATQLETE